MNKTRRLRREAYRAATLMLVAGLGTGLAAVWELLSAERRSKAAARGGYVS